MKYFYLTLCLCCHLLMDAQIITEIMYNPPESGSDSLEYIEIYNDGLVDVDLLGHSLIGVSYDFTDSVVMAPDSYVILCKDSLALLNVFGVSGYEWNTGALSNGGEEVGLVNAAGEVVISVTYDTNDPWAESADGEGTSLELCDVTSDWSLGESWAAATNEVILADTTFIYGSPGMQNSCDTLGMSALSGIEFAPEVVVSPNPTYNSITVESDLKIEQIHIVNQVGSVLMIENNTNVLDIAHLPSGAYFLRLFVGEQSVVRRVVKL